MRTRFLLGCHAGRKHLIRQVLEWHLSPDVETREILEVGAGVGQNIEVLSNFGTVDALEIDPLGLERLHRIQSVRNVIEQGIPCDLGRQYDVICACDVIEHLKDDAAAIRWIFDSLRPEGLFFATVPAHQWLFSDHDRALGHFRRYEAEAFDRLLPENAVRLSGSYFNTYLLPLIVVSRTLYQIRRWIQHPPMLEKQKVPTHGLIEPGLRWVFTHDVSALRPSTRRATGLSYYVCARKRGWRIFERAFDSGVCVAATLPKKMCKAGKSSGQIINAKSTAQSPRLEGQRSDPQLL